jgi:aminoglycoside phosphotransferase (APT) family kinase protein/tetratricopeptide (TPR) repeat protein
VALTPRFRPGASRRPFVDREAVCRAFDETLDSLDTGPRILNLVGVGGIGKSRLLVELRARVGGRMPTALLDLQVPAQREHQDALAVVRQQFGSRAITFHRFDIAFAVLWQRLHPRLELTKSGLPFVEQSEILTTLLDEAVGMPAFGIGVRLVDMAHKRFRQWRTTHGDDVMAELDSLPLPQLIDAVTYLFAEDLRQAQVAPYVMFVDAYEALVGGVARAGRTAVLDGWLRDLVAQLDTGLAVIAGREPLGWDRYSREWSALIRTVQVEELPFDARLEFLRASGVVDESLAQAVAVGSAGLPFFLNLAADTRGSAGSVVSPEALLERFLQHVDPADIRVLELLSVTRSFDRGVFDAVSEAYGLPAHTLAWESLTGYSFVRPAGPDALTLHQLMLFNLRQRLSDEMERDLHALLYGVWRVRAAGSSTGIAAKITATREAAYHGLRSGQLDAAGLLDHADTIRVRAATTGVDGIAADLDEYLAEHPDARLSELATCLEAETALMLGAASDAAAATASVPALSPDTEVQARLAVAAANAQRILGNTTDALHRYEMIWHGYSGPARLEAGLWAADLRMAQGRFTAAAELAGEVEALVPPDRRELRGHLARLLHLAYRFCLDFERAAHYLEQARQEYAEVGSVLGLANVATNTVEQLAVTAPAQAIAAAADAIEVQRDLAAEHELGKLHSAVGLAHLALGEFDAAQHSLDAACASLERAGYRSGRARAELYRAFLHARQGHVEEAVGCARWAVAELEATEVYPTLTVIAARTLARIGRPDPAIEAAAERALAQIRILGTGTDLESRITGLLDRVLGDRRAARYAAALAESSPLSGFYNRNVRVDGDLIRIPIPGAAQMDLTIWPEPMVLAAVGRHLDTVPRLRSMVVAPAYQVQEFVTGEVVDVRAPRGTPVPGALIEALAGFFASLARVPLTDLPPVPADWPTDGDTPSFAARLAAVTEQVRQQNMVRYGALWNRLGFPADPLAILDWTALRHRPFRLVHADVHRKNLIVTDTGIVVLDWELALWGDPVYDLATHLHKMGYRPAEEQELVRAWADAQTPAGIAGWMPDLRLYRRHERIKSALVDSVRYSQLINDPTTAAARIPPLVVSLTDKVRAARAEWEDTSSISQADVEAAVRDCDPATS